MMSYLRLIDDEFGRQGIGGIWNIYPAKGVEVEPPPDANRPLARNMIGRHVRPGRSRIKISIKETPCYESWGKADLVEAT
jgi:hypothetical protein